MEGKKKNLNLYQETISNALDCVWSRLLEEDSVNEFMNDSFHLQRNRTLTDIAVLADSLKIVLLSVHYVTWKQLVMAIRIWESNVFSENEDSIWEAERQILGPIAEMLSNKTIRLDERFSAQTLVEAILTRGDSMFVDANEEVWDELSPESLGKDEMQAWKESSDWDIYRKICNEDAYRQSMTIVSLC